MPVDRVEQNTTAIQNPSLKPTRTIEEMEPVRAATFEQDVKPFSESIARSAVVFVSGILVFIMFLWASMDYPQIRFLIYVIVPISIILFIYGASKLLVQRFLMKDYFERQWKTKLDTEEYEEGTQVASPKSTIWVTLDAHTQVALPPEPRPGAYANFAKDYVSGNALFSEMGSHEKNGASFYGFSTSDYNAFRDIMLKNNLAVWRHEQYPQQGVRLTPRGDKVMSEIANTGPAAIEQFLSQH